MDGASKDIEDNVKLSTSSATKLEYAGVQIVHVATESDIATLERIWAASQDADEAAFKPDDGWWSLSDWATESWLLLQDEEPVGVVAIHSTQDEEVAQARLALLPAFRQPVLALLMVDHVLLIVESKQKTRLRIVTSGNTSWAGTAVQQRGFSLLRPIYMMLRPASSPPLSVQDIEGIRVRSLRAGEESSALAALNRAWANTWNYHPITMEALLSDLNGKLDNFFVAVDQADDTRILGTVHALFDREARNPDGHPSAWISNLTVDPSQRSRGLGRMLLTIALNYLTAQGAGSVTLGVDGGSVAPVSLYRSVGFEAIRTIEIWDLDFTATPAQ
ncbi:GNAT family N-acetyltransferase [Dictyobacter formicarum]|uniref:N-acetyltransferase domain-containing protein n=1 Tax=Dictyobacter formicarum TaxID=2778368 RepID=A0ABQ3VIK8_9CHLR|nr:N-acetyltransferase [Dictyobacter formicarum]GHO84961.1 hypothetical protein KSZ_29670 [Dictyobacter formicarum]